MRQFFEITKEGTENNESYFTIVKKKLYKRVEVFKLEKNGKQKRESIKWK